MTIVRAPASLVPPSVSDARGRAFGVAMERAIADADFRALLFERVDDVDARLLPFLVREFSMEEFIEPDMREPLVRALLKRAYGLHARKGYIDGVRTALELIGVRVAWRQWFEVDPPGAPGTHEATLYVRRRVFVGAGPVIDERMQRAALRMISGMKRWSQDIAFKLAVEARADVGVAARSRALAFAAPAAAARPPAPPPFAARAGVAAHSRGLALATSEILARPPAPRPASARVGVALATQCLALLPAVASASYEAQPPRTAVAVKVWSAAAALLGARVEVAPGAPLGSQVGALAALAAPLAIARCRMEALS